MIEDQVFVLRSGNQEIWKAMMNGEVLSPEWNSKGAAQAGLEVERRRKSKKAIAVHLIPPDGGNPICGTAGKNLSATHDQLLATCKRCLALVGNKTLHPAPEAEYSVVLTRCGPSRIALVKVIHEHCNLGLKEAKELTDITYYSNKPVTIFSATRDKAYAIKQAVVNAGGKAKCLLPHEVLEQL